MGLAALATSMGVPGAAVANPGVRWWKAYWNTRGGQVHIHNAAPAESVRQKTPLVCLHPSAYSGAFFAEYQALMAVDRWVLSPDTPGFGASFKPTAVPTMEDYANTLAEVLDGLGFGTGGAGPVDVLGFHTGCFIATELAAQRPDLVKRLVLPGIPFHVGEERRAQYKKNAKPKALYEDPKELGRMWEERWEWQGVAVSLPRLLELLGEELVGGPNTWWAYDAVFSYAAEQQLPKITAPTLAIATGGDLFEPTKAAAQLIPNSTLESFPDRDAPLFNKHYALTAEVTRRYLDG
jgi:pimeloyl-ACP methyl ester carboxylesterase